MYYHTGLLECILNITICALQHRGLNAVWNGKSSSLLLKIASVLSFNLCICFEFLWMCDASGNDTGK